MQLRIVVSGVSGSGKSTVGGALAERLGLGYADGDDFHSHANIDKMTSGIALTDKDRRPWLLEIGRWLDAQEDGAVVACSALKRSYRDLIRHTCEHVGFVQLIGDPDVIEQRQAAREGHFMPKSLMNSQFATLEPLAPDEHGIVIDVGPPVDVLVTEIVTAFQE